MSLTRREFLASGVVMAWCGQFSVVEAEEGVIEMRARKVQLGLMEGGAGAAEGFLFGDGPAPAVVRARQGEPLALRFVNELDAEIWLHFFGVRGPSDLMTINVPPGADHAVDCRFTPPDAGTFWIGPVSDVSRLRDMGLYAMLVVAEASAMPELADLPLVMDDWKLTDAGAITNGFGDVEAMVGEGRLGNWFTVNNGFRPQMPLLAGVFTRLRLLNAANVRSMGVLFKGHDPLLLARDGQPVKPRPLGSKALLLAPGQRADLLVGPESGDIVVALDLFEDVVEIAYLNRGGQSVVATIADNFALPDNPVPRPQFTADARTVALVIEGGIKGGLQSAIFAGRVMDLRTLLEHGKGWALNGVAGPAAEPLFTATRGETVVLTVENRTAFTQALHIHGHAWQLPAGEGEDPAVSDAAVIGPGQSRKLAFVADNPGTWAIHSLHAERCDGGMIGAFVVQDAQL
ncbi:MAG: multicopper oxidase family protein [Alphaproteobacteria bacterium]|nr:multicopper oxidase family protein [Alphaproteobacteria bacterium]